MFMCDIIKEDIMTTIAIRTNEKLDIKKQTLAALIAIITAVALPQMFHVMGAMSGLGTALGEAFLPMHLPIIMVGLFAGPYAGAIAGAFSPLISVALTGMPTLALLPFMMIELCVYGIVAGILKDTKMPTITKVLITQVAGRAVRAVAILIATYGFDSTKIPVSIIWTSITVGIFGIVLQWVLLPLISYRVEGAKSHE